LLLLFLLFSQKLLLALFADAIRTLATFDARWLWALEYLLLLGDVFIWDLVGAISTVLAFKSARSGLILDNHPIVLSITLNEAVRSTDATIANDWSDAGPVRPVAIEVVGEVFLGELVATLADARAQGDGPAWIVALYVIAILPMTVAVHVVTLDTTHGF